ncbi:iron complex outermembrane receptor protein/outer membrane receptor for ferric coprogen and ferric-rhodotorulic acid [Acidovorax soli]|uniref:Iron complex outermembrane receptor protein/outer membrane receptor for ferric coprogen and ferric-rhodotorulic acid n=1 Tax=Acidovorax soli TaxID=592050 RepID=A0A7X0U9S2_9BURK|nr:TonB-dependent siderophore receptor [Acidovorax soli]MBB6560476.1 iron complex outermembrane receptor protein/outer membrane receptor for ferric coprogen and ferric-rhodotorulic acid [Acidovorax soli]
MPSIHAPSRSRTAAPRFPLSTLALLAACSCLAAGAAHAQDAALPEVKVTNSSDTTEGTGQYTARQLSVGKMDQAPREIPQSISVITRQQLDDRNVTKVEDAVKYSTGINVTRFDGAGNYNTFQSRGFDLGAIQLDGVPIPQGNYSTLDTAMYDRIEVLRGPAGLLQGGSEPGGTVNLVRKRAPGKLMLNADAAVGSFGLRRGTVDVGGALNASGTVRARAVAVAEDRDSHVDTVFNNKRLGYGTLEWDIAPSTTLSIGGAQQRVRASIDQGLPTYADGRLASLPRGAFSGLAANRQDLETTDLFAELEHRLAGGGTLRLSARDVDRTAYYRSARANSALSANGNFTMETVDGLTHVKTRNYDLFTSLPVQVAGRTHRLLVGASHSENKSYDNNYGYGPSYQANLLAPNYAQAYPDIQLPGYTAITTRTEKALYGQAQISVADSVKLLAGGRLSWADAVTRSTSTGAATSVADPGRQFVPSVAVLWDFHPQYTAYAGYSETFVVQSQLDAAKKLLEPRTGKQVEVGVKGEFLDKRLQAHAAIFRIIDENRAMADPNVANASIAAGKVRSQGFEAEVSGQPQPGWDVVAGYAYNDTLYLKAPVAQVGQIFSPVTPRHSVNLFTRYAFTSPALRGFSIGGGLSYRSDFFAQSGALRITSGDYVLASAQVGYQINDQLALNLSVDNLFDKTYYEKVSIVARQNFYGEPRRVTLALKARY